jgi:hypothetical protein
VATVFVDHYSDLDYVHIQESTSADDTIEAKRTFENFCFNVALELSIITLIMGFLHREGFEKRFNDVVRS